MNRTVITFERFGDSVLVKLDDSPLNIPGRGDNEKIDISRLPGNIVERGKRLMELLSAHPPVKEGLGAVLVLPPGSPPSPLCFRVRVAAADAVPWEQIWVEHQGFCALQDRWPILRIAGQSCLVEPRNFVPPLRIVAVLSAAGRTGVPQLRSILAAVRSEAAAKIGVQLHVISGEEDVQEAAVGPEVSFELIETSGPGLRRQIARAKPHILHLLCHGGVVAGARVLSFGKLTDFDAGEDRSGSLGLMADDLIATLNECHPWLVVLNACETADASAGDGPALAHDLASGGMPAVIGMRRLVDLGETNRFCAELYPELLAVVRNALGDAANAERTIDWSAALTGPRKVMSGADPAAMDSWSDPVLYVQSDPLRIVPRSVEFLALSAKRDQFVGFLAALDPATTQPGVIEDVQKRINAIEDELAAVGP